MTLLAGSGETKAKSPYVDVRQVLNFLSTLYKNKAYALVRENLQNSIDAKAKNIDITFNPNTRMATFTDDGTGIAVQNMTERKYFAIMWSTKRGKKLIGSKGIGRLTNLAAARTITVETHDGENQAVFLWHYTGGFSKRPTAPRSLTRRGFSLTLHSIYPAVAADLPKKIEGVTTEVFDSYLRKGVSVRFNGKPIKPKEYTGRRSYYRLATGEELEIYWNPGGQPPEDQGVVLKCRGVRVTAPTRLGIDSDGWQNVAAILHLDDLDLTANREDFEDTPRFRSAISDAASKMRSFLARHEKMTMGRLSEMAEQYTRAAREAAERLGVRLTLLGPMSSEYGMEAPAEGVEGQGVHALPSHETEREKNPTRRRKEGEEPGFRLIPRQFSMYDDLAAFASEMSTRMGATIFVNLGHPACPANRYARSLYIWCCGFSEIVKWGGLGTSDELNRDKLLSFFNGWIRSWTPALVPFTPSGEP